MSLTKNEREQGYLEPPRPSPHTVAILRRVARGYLLVTHGTNDKNRPEIIYCYDDGTGVRDFRGKPISSRKIHTMVAEGWLIPVKGESLFPDGTPQRYRARTLEDGMLPRIIKK